MMQFFLEHHCWPGCCRGRQENKNCPLALVIFLAVVLEGDAGSAGGMPGGRRTWVLLEVHISKEHCDCSSFT